MRVASRDLHADCLESPYFPSLAFHLEPSAMPPGPMILSVDSRPLNRSRMTLPEHIIMISGNSPSNSDSSQLRDNMLHICVQHGQ
eukprot:g63086.t1